MTDKEQSPFAGEFKSIADFTGGTVAEDAQRKLDTLICGAVTLLHAQADRIASLHAESEKLLAENARLREKLRLKIVPADPVVLEENEALRGIAVEPEEGEKAK